jgi:hypothetical protein
MHMPTQMHRTYRITIDIATTSYAQPPGAEHDARAVRSHLGVMERLQAHPEVLDPLLRSLIISRLDEAKKLLDAEYGCRLSEHDLLRPVIAELEPEVQTYLTEELEDGCQVFYFDGFEANLKRYQMRLLEGESS